MAKDAVGAALHVAAAWGNLSEILTIENGSPPPVEPVKAKPTIVASYTFNVDVLNKWYLRPQQGIQHNQKWASGNHARLKGQVRPPL